MFCEKCGKELKDDWKKCPYCGNEIFEKVENTETSAEAEDMESGDFVVYELQGMRPLYSRIPIIPRIGKIITEIKLEGEDVHIVTQGIKKAECHFRKQDIQKIDIPLLPVWTFGDVILLACFGLWVFILLLISGIYISTISSIVAVLYFFNTMFLRHVRIRLNSGKTIKIPICQKEEAFELLKEFQYPLSELEKNDTKQMSDDELGSWIMRKWIISVALFLTAGVGMALAVAMRGDLDSNLNEAVETDADVDSSDLEWILGEAEEALIKSGFSMEEDGSYSFLEGDVIAACEDGKVSYVMIQGSENDTPGFHGVRVGMDVDNADTVLADKYQYTSEEKEEGKKVVAYFDAESSICILLYSDVDGDTAGSITEIYAVWYSEEKLQELYGGENGETQENIQEEPKEEQTTVNTQKKEESEEQPENQSQEYIFSDSNSRYLSEEEIRSIDADKLRIARNEIFARHGYIFNDEELSQYFNSTSWYDGTIPSDQFDMDAVLNDFEKKNIELIERAENEADGTSVQNSEQFVIPAGTYVNNELFEDHQALMKLTYYEGDEVGVEFFTEPRLNGINLYGAKIDDRTIQVTEEYEGIIVTLTWDSETEVTAVSSGEFTGMDSSLFDDMTNAHYSFVTGN